MVFTGTIANVFGLTVSDPMLWVFAAVGAMLFIGVIDGWFPNLRRFPPGDGDDDAGA
jgi:hypothetical protein